MRAAFTILCFVMALFFAFAVFVQHNDPDPYLWVPIYGVPLVLSILAGIKRRIFWPAIIFAVPVFAYALFYVPIVVGGGLDLFDAEEGREMLGLFIVSIWCAAIGLARRR